MARAHIKSLTENQIPAARVQILQNLVWSIVRTTPNGVVLGDAGAVAREIDGTQFKHPFALSSTESECSAALSVACRFL